MLLWLGKKPEVIYKQEIISKWSSILVLPKNKWKNYEKGGKKCEKFLRKM